MQWALFKHSRALQAQDVLRMQVVEVGGRAIVGFSVESYDVEKHNQTVKSTAVVNLYTGTTFINSDISRDGEEHVHHGLLKDHIPKTLSYDLTLRINKDGNVPQIRFDDDAVWQDFAPGRVAVKTGPWFPFLMLREGDRLSDHCVHRPMPTNSAGKSSKASAASAAAASAAGAGAGAGAASNDESIPPPPQKKARHDEGGGPK